MSMIKQKGSAIALLLPLILVGTLFAYLFSYFSCSIPAGGPVPYIFVSIFIFPITAIWPLLKDLTELQEVDSITQTEKNRLSIMVISAQNYLIMSAFILLLFGITAGGLLYLVVVGTVTAKLALGIIGFFVGSGICIFVFLFRMRTKVQDYKVNVSKRIENLKQTQKLLRRAKSTSKK